MLLAQFTGGVTALLPTTTWAGPNTLFPNTDRNDSATYAFNAATSTVTLPSTGLADGYIFMWGFEFADTSNGRCNPQGRMAQTVGTGDFATASTGGFNRDASEDRSYVSGWSFVGAPSASSAFQFQWRRDTDVPTGGTVRSFLQVIPVYYSAASVYTSAATAAPGGITPVQVTGLSGSDTTNITLTSNTATLSGVNKRYLCLGSVYHQGIGNARTQRWYGFRVDGVKDDTAKGCMYYRQSSDADGGAAFTKILERTSTNRTIDLFQYRGDGIGANQGGADVDGNTTGVNSSHSMVIIELNDSAEVWQSNNGANSQQLALTGPIDINVSNVEVNDSASFTASTSTAVNAEKTADVFAFANISHARGAVGIGSGTRWTVHGEFTVNGAEQTNAGFHGNYNRGNQGTQDCFGSSTNQGGFLSVTAGDDLGVSNQELAGTEGGAGDVSTQNSWVGFGLINLDTLEGGGGSGTDYPLTISESLSGTVSHGGRMVTKVTVNETANSTDAGTGTAEINQSVIETLQAGDITESVLHAVITNELNANATDVMATLASYGLTLQESGTASDALIADTKTGLKLILGDVITATDNMSVSTSFKLSIDESALVTDSGITQANLMTSIIESLSALDASITQANMVATIPESLNATDNIESIKSSTYTLTIGELVTAVDGLSVGAIPILITATISLSTVLNADISDNQVINATLNTKPSVSGAYTDGSTIDGDINDHPVITGTITVS